MEIDPLAPSSLQPASYEMRVGHEAYVSSSEEKIDVRNKGLVIIDPGEFAVVITRERACIAGHKSLVNWGCRQPTRVRA